MIIAFHHDVSGVKQYTNYVRLILRNACGVIKCKKPPAVAIIFVSDQKMRQLNRVYRSKDKSANVLSFDTGDIFISVPFAKREAKKFKWTLKYEISRLALHGFLHLVGYDHMKVSDARKMEKLESKILKP